MAVCVAQHRLRQSSRQKKSNWKQTEEEKRTRLTNLSVSSIHRVGLWIRAKVYNSLDQIGKNEVEQVI